MDGSEDTKIGPRAEPRPLRWARLLREFSDLVFPVIVGALALAAAGVLLFRPDLRDPQIMGMVGGALLTLGGLGLRRRP